MDIHVTAERWERQIEILKKLMEHKPELRGTMIMTLVQELGLSKELDNMPIARLSSLQVKIENAIIETLAR